MKQILSCLIVVLISFSAMAEHHGSDDADLNAAIKAFDHAYATNDIETYFSYYEKEKKIIHLNYNNYKETGNSSLREIANNFRSLNV